MSHVAGALRFVIAVALVVAGPAIFAGRVLPAVLPALPGVIR